jgi:hypothetical protein
VNVPTWLAAIIAGALLTSMLGIVKLVNDNAQTNVGQNEKIRQIEERQVIARGVVDRVDAQLAALRERLARLERETP